MRLLSPCSSSPPPSPALAQARPRPARDLGVKPGIFAPGPLDAITDVAGVRGSVTRPSLRATPFATGVTAILPTAATCLRPRARAVHVGNAFGKLVGSTQVQELGELETPILLTARCAYGARRDALVDELIAQTGWSRRVDQSVVGETNDGGLNAIRTRPVGRDAVHARWPARMAARSPKAASAPAPGPSPSEWKGGIAPRRASCRVGRRMDVGVLVQSNFGGVLQVLGAPVGRELGRYAFRTTSSASEATGRS